MTYQCNCVGQRKKVNKQMDVGSPSFLGGIDLDQTSLALAKILGHGGFQLNISRQYDQQVGNNFLNTQRNMRNVTKIIIP